MRTCCVCVCVRVGTAHAPAGRAPTAAELQSFERFDRNLDGRLGEAELLEALDVKSRRAHTEPQAQAQTPTQAQTQTQVQVPQPQATSAPAPKGEEPKL